MAILGQILGSSFGRAPASFGQPIHMPGINIPQMASDPNADAYHAGGGRGGQPAQGQQQGQSIDDIINGFKARLQALHGGGAPGGAQGIGPEPAPVPVAQAGDPMAMSSMTGGMSGGAPGGVMNSIMGAFGGGGAGAGIDPSMLASLLPMLGL